MRRHCYKALSPPFRIQGFFGNRSHNLHRSDFSDAAYGPLPGLLHNRSPSRSFIAAISCSSPKYHRLLRHLSRLSNSYCTTITPVFSPRLGFLDISVNGLGTGCLLGWSFYYFLFFTLAPHDCVTYYQARGLSGHTSPCGECAFLILGLHLGTGCLLGWSHAFLLLWTLAPRDYVTYCQARGLSGHPSLGGECALSGLRATPGDWLPVRLVFYYFFYFGP